MSEKREFVLGVLVGAAVGAVAALLYAPQGGEETRGLIRQKSTEARDKVAGVAGNVKETVTHKADELKTSTRELVDRGRGFVEEKKSQVTAAVDAGKQAFTKKKSDLEAEVRDDLGTQLGSAAAGNGGKSSI